MAEGAEETDSNSNADTPAMLGTVLPCEAITASLCGMKREFDSICVQPSPPVPHATLTASAVRTAKSPSPSSSSGNVQQHPINLKSEECEKELPSSKIRPASPSISISEKEKEQQRSEYYKSIGTNNDRASPHEQAKVVAAAAAAQAHLNGTMQDMINLQKLQNLASMQQQHQQQQQHSSVPAALAGLQGLGGISSAAALNSPLNLSVGSTSTLSSTNTKPPASGALGGSGGGVAGCSPPGGSQMPQLILASGQLVQGVQGAQLLIPTSQGVAVQTILTIPVSQQINTNEQFLQSYVALNSGAVAFNNSALGAHALPMQPQSNLLKPNFFSPGVQQLLAALHPELFSGSHHPPETIHPGHSQQTQETKNPHIQQIHKQQVPHQPLSNHHRTESISPKIETPQIAVQLRDSSSPSPATQHLRASPLSSLSSNQHSLPSPTRTSNLGSLGLNLTQEKPATAPTPPVTSNYSSPSGSQVFRTHSPNSHMTSSSHSLSSQVNTPSSVCVLSSINRLTSANGELTITKSHGPPNNSMNTSSSSPSPGSTHQQNQPMKLSPGSMQISPTGTEASTTDLLVDSPNEPTINQTNCNVVDGIDLDEIKEFAKAFKLRRLSLGLTQTQVGQALSVTEGPAYSQSAICSALAAQMYAAQLSSQQQNMFEKLDITPKSAQKIKPVLERWMKEAEESHWNRYKAGQNHLTDFIGVEPSKKRKRRTSFTPQALELLNAHFERNTHPSGTEITGLAHQLGYEREVIRIWFCNKRQALKNTVRMMSKGMV